MRLTAEQRAAAESDAAATVIIAGAGTGKTRTIVARACHLIRAGAVPESIQILTFTRAAAGLIRSRIVEEIGDFGDRTRVETFHGWAARLLRRGGALPPSIRLATDQEDEAALRGCWDGPYRVSSATRTTRTEVRSAITRWEATGEEPSQPDTPSYVAAVYRAWLARLYAQGLRPYSWLLPALLHHDAWKGGIAHVLVDEGHDCTPLEAALANVAAARSLTIVIDPRQAIYGWRGGMEAESVDGFVRGMTEDMERVEIRSLRQTFRVGPRLAAYANAVASRMYRLPRDPLRLGWDDLEPADPEKSGAAITASWTCGEDVGHVIDAVQRRHGPGRVAVLCRTNRLADMVQRSILAAVRVGGPTSDGDIAWRALCMARLALDPRDDSAFLALARIDAVPEAVILDMDRHRGVADGYWHLWSRSTGKAVRGLDHRLHLHTIPPPTVARVLTLGGLLRAVVSCGPGATREIPEVVRARGVADEDHGRLIADSIDLLTDATRDDSRGLSAAAAMDLTPVGTVHAMKGTEYEAVVIVGDGRWPRQHEGEEARVFYVALTRARSEIVVAHYAGPGVWRQES